MIPQELLVVVPVRLKTKVNRFTLLVAAGLLAVAIAGCANAPLNRESVQKLPSIHVVQVVTPSLEAPTFMQAAVKSRALGGALPETIVESQAKTTFSPPTISDFGTQVTEKLKSRIREKVVWWPPMTSHESVVPGNYVYPHSAWLRVEVTRYEIAAGFGRLLVNVNVSLLNARNQGGLLWSKNKAFSGLVHGGEKIVMENLPNDPSQLNREIERAADWVAKEILLDITKQDQ